MKTKFLLSALTLLICSHTGFSQENNAQSKKFFKTKSGEEIEYKSISKTYFGRNHNKQPVRLACLVLESGRPIAPENIAKKPKKDKKLSDTIKKKKSFLLIDNTPENPCELNPRDWHRRFGGSSGGG